MQYLKDLKENERVVEHYLCKQKQTLKTKTGKPYFSLKLQDKTAVVDSKVWEINSDISEFEENDVIKIDGVVQLYNSEPQLKISRIRKSLEGEYDPTEYVPRTEKDIDQLYSQLLTYIESINQPYIRRLLTGIVIDNEDISKAITSHSAAKNLHHSYYGGLLEHLIAVTDICDFISKRYKFIDRDILIAGAILHDIAKIFELSPMPTNIYTDDGQMLGHIYMGAELISKEAAKIKDFPHTLESMLKHLILSHHGEYEFGSPKLPMTMEAFILHAADNMDAKIKVLEETIAGDVTPGVWLGYNKMLNRYLRKSDYEDA
ncbi:MAG: HD domain-containing protein [Defluviitaleaceae bacterium]|nr:HD domain-containing protein [Defluviitaleaceae bacterium]